MTNITPKPGKIEIDFTDEAITPLAGSLFLSRVAEGLGLAASPASRRLNDYLLRFGGAQVEALEGVCRAVAGKVAPSVAAHMSQTLGYVPLFIDGAAIERVTTAPSNTGSIRRMSGR